MSAVAQQDIPASIATGYTATGAFDELIGPDGVPAAHWQPILERLDALDPEHRAERAERISTRVRETGIAHDLFADPSRNVQPWQLNLFPLAFPAAEWARIETAVLQRARLLEGVLTDLYGPQELMRQGLIPPRLVFADPSYLRACRGIGPDGRRLQFLAADLTRSADGSWRIVDVHAETPAGIGYALANRTVITRVCGDVFAASRAVRLAPFFQRMQDALAQRVDRHDPTVALLTPGPHHDDYFSHAYLARYLGALLIEGEDLRVDSDRIYLKTLEGLRPIDLLIRCVSAGLTDALELEPSGFLGPVGLVQAVRRQPSLVVNALGAAIVENRGLGRYMDEICRAVLGEKLAVADVDKLWLGDAIQRQHVLANLDRYFIRRAFEETARPGRAAAARNSAQMSSSDRAQMIERIGLDGDCLVAEEKLTLGTSPVYGPRGLQPKPYVIRVFATAVPGGFAVMPGGLAMHVDPGASMALTAPDSSSQDVWVLSGEIQPPFKSLWLPTIEEAQIQRGLRELPSRAADNLFWLGRYVESVDWTFRLLRNCLARIEVDSGPRQSLQLSQTVLEQELCRGGGAPEALTPGLSQPQAIAALAHQLMTSAGHAYALPQRLAHIHRVAGLTRDRLSLEAWRTLNQFHVAERWQRDALPVSIGESLDLIDSGLGVVAAFNGLSHENMTRNFGWAFLDLGRRMARAENMARMLHTAFSTRDGDRDEVARLLFVLELADSFITYRSRYRLDPLLPLVLDLLIVDETNPRSLAFQLRSASEHIETLPQTGKGRGRSEVQRVALAMLTDIRLAEVALLSEAGPRGERTELSALMSGIVERMPKLSEAITRRYFSMLEKGPRWVRVRSRRLP